MKKFAKMSLVAAVAVAGLSTTASAKPLEDAIKNVDVSGTMVYRYNDYETVRKTSDNSKVNTTNNYVRAALNLKSKVNDDVTANLRFLAGTNTGMTSNDTSTNGMDTTSVDLSEANFAYTGIANTTIKLGKQGLATPFTVVNDSTGAEQTGIGALAISNVGPVTLAAAYFNSTNLDSAADDLGLTLTGAENIWTVAAMANVGPVALDAWYLDLEDTFDVYTIGASANFDVDSVKVNVGARHTALDLDGQSIDNSLTQLNVGAKMGIFGASVAYGWTDDEGGAAALDSEAKTAFEGWVLSLNGEADADLLLTNVNVDVMPNLNVALNYNILDRANDEAKNLYTQVTYKMSKNFMTYVRLGQRDDDAKNEKDTIGRLHVQYSF